MGSVKFKSRRSAGKVSERLNFAVNKLQAAEAKLKDLLDYGKRILETAEYSEARMEVLYWQRRVSDLRKLQYLRDGRRFTKKIGLGSTVVVKYGAVVKEYTLVTSLEADPANGQISIESPLGRALLDRKVKDEVMVRAPSGEYAYSIQSVA